jgi:hypothetical protein
VFFLIGGVEIFFHHYFYSCFIAHVAAVSMMDSLSFFDDMGDLNFLCEHLHDKLPEPQDLSGKSENDKETQDFQPTGSPLEPRDEFGDIEPSDTLQLHLLGRDEDEDEILGQDYDLNAIREMTKEFDREFDEMVGPRVVQLDMAPSTVVSMTFTKKRSTSVHKKEKPKKQKTPTVAPLSRMTALERLVPQEKRIPMFTTISQEAIEGSIENLSFVKTIDFSELQNYVRSCSVTDSNETVNIRANIGKTADTTKRTKVVESIYRLMPSTQVIDPLILLEILNSMRQSLERFSRFDAVNKTFNDLDTTLYYVVGM